MPNWGANEGQEKHRFKIHFGGSNGDLAAPRVISGSHFGSFLEPRSWKKGPWDVRLHPWSLKVALRQRQMRPRAHIYIEMAFIFLMLLNILCASCAATYLWPVSLIFSVGFAFHSSLSFPMHCRAEHSTVRQSSAQQRLPPSAADQQLTQHSCAHWKTTHT